MFRSSVLSLTLTLLGFTASFAADAPASAPAPVRGEARAVTETPARAAEATTRPVYGPITSKDPAVRAQVKRLYLERGRLHDDTRARLAELAAELKSETDPDFRWEISREIARQKKDLELRSMELGLEIARLNEDATRVAEFELAIDQVTHPEKYRPAPADPSVQRERIREMEANGGAR